MFQFLRPDLQIHSYHELDADKLVRDGISLLICDIDNTLAVHDETMPCAEVVEFVEKIQSAGLKLCLISNNRKKRVERFGEALGVRAYAFALKPMKHTYRTILKDYQVSGDEIACLGDQLLTDGIGAKRMKMKLILSQPLSEKDIIYTKMNRHIERWILRMFEKRKNDE